MSLRACVKIIPSPAVGASVVTVTGIADDAGVFTPKLVIFMSNAVLDTISGSGIVNWVIGVDDGTTHLSYGMYEAAMFGTPGNKVCTSIVSDRWSITRFHYTFPGTVDRKARVTAFASGTMDLTYDLNSITGDCTMAVILGGDDLTILRMWGNGTTTVTPGFEAQAAILMSLPPVSDATSDPVISAGGGNFQMGWDTRSSGRGTVDSNIIQVSANGRYLTEDDAYDIVDSTLTVSSRRRITSWSATAFTTNITSSSSISYVCIGGTDVMAAAGSFFEPTEAGIVEVTTGLDNKVVLILSVCAEESTTVGSPLTQLVFGAMAETGQACYWHAEDAINTPVHCTRSASESDILMACTTPNKSSTVIVTRAQKHTLSENGKFKVNFSLTDGIPRQYIYLALGGAPADAVVTLLSVNCAADPKTITVTGVNFAADVVVALTLDGNPVTFTLTRESSTELTLSNLSPVFSAGNYCVTANNP